MHLLVVQHAVIMPYAHPSHREDGPQRENNGRPGLNNPICIPVECTEFAAIPSLQQIKLAVPQASRASDISIPNVRLKLPNTGNSVHTSTTEIGNLTLNPIDCGVSSTAHLPPSPEARAHPDLYSWVCLQVSLQTRTCMSNCIHISFALFWRGSLHSPVIHRLLNYKMCKLPGLRQGEERIPS